MPLDIGAGMLIAIALQQLFHAPHDLWVVGLGVAFALLPDIDMLWYLSKQPAQRGHDHRTYPHYPLVWAPSIACTYLVFGAFTGTLLLACITMHLLHDTFGLGWGIKWLWPLSQKKFHYAAVARTSNEHWVIAYYLRPSLVGGVEYGVLVVALACLAMYAL
jgi:hypothetical protein